MGANILAVDDDRDTRELIRHVLSEAGHNIVVAASADQALERLKTSREVDLVIVDIMMPGLGGERLCRVLRGEESTRRLLLVALTSVKREADLLNAGFDDYIMKPVHPETLVARVGALLRRLSPVGQPADAIHVGDLVLDTGAHVVSLKGKALPLTPTEFRLLALLLANPGRVLTHERLGEDLWNTPEAVYKHAVETHVMNLRRKLGPAGARVVTVKGIGYKFDR